VKLKKNDYDNTSNTNTLEIGRIRMNIWTIFYSSLSTMCVQISEKITEEDYLEDKNDGILSLCTCEI